MAFEQLRNFFDENGERLDPVVEIFATYQPRPVSRNRLWNWLRQFNPQDYLLLVRLLEQVQYYDFARINALLRQLHRAVREQLSDDGIKQLNRIIFAPLGGAGESGHEIFRRYRDVNRLQQTSAVLALVPELQQLIVNSRTANQKVGVVLLDDFIGTGEQLEDYWNQVLTQVIPPPHEGIYVASLAACNDGVVRAQEKTPLRVITAHYVPTTAQLHASPHFDHAEKNRIRAYCGAIGNQPFGFGDLELLIAFTHSCPDNTPSILRGAKNQRKWVGILPRYDDL